MPHGTLTFTLTALARVVSAGLEVSVINLSAIATKQVTAEAISVDYTTLDGAAKMLALKCLPHLRKLAKESHNTELVGAEVKIYLKPGQRAPKGFREFKGWIFPLGELAAVQAKQAAA